MANSSQKDLPDFGWGAQSQTLFLPAPGRLGQLVKMGRRPRSVTKKFAGPEAALAWCLRTRTALVYFFPPMAVQN